MFLAALNTFKYSNTTQPKTGQMHHIIVYAFVIVILSCPTIQNLLHYSRMMGSSDAPSCIIFHSWVFCELCHLGQHSKLVLVFLLWNNNFCSVFPPICSLSSSSFWICVDLDCFGLLSGPWMHVQPSDSVVYAVINRGSCVFMYSMSWQWSRCTPQCVHLHELSPHSAAWCPACWQ